MTDFSIVGSEPVQSEHSVRRKEPSPKPPNYLLRALLLNGIVWAGALAYLSFAPRKYTSQWGVVVVGTNPGIDVSLPERGRTAPNPYSERPWIFQDPRSAYSYLATNPALLEAAAKSLNMPVSEFGKPTVTVDKESAVIALQMQGGNPEEAQRKARALHSAMIRQVNQLREAQLQEDVKETQKTLESASQRLDLAKRQLSRYRDQSLLLSEEQVKQLATNLEDLYRQRAELASQDQGLRNRLNQLAQDATLSSKEARESYALAADEVYKKQFEDYGRLAAEYKNISSQLGSEHPQVLEKRAAAAGAAEALRERGSQLLGRLISLADLTKIAPVMLDPRVTATRESLFPDLISSRAKQQETSAMLTELDRQITALRGRLQQLSKEAIVTDSIKRDIQISEAIFTSNLAKVDGQRNIDSIYPPMQLVAEPNLPREATAPNLQIALLGGVAGSLLVTAGLLLSWYEKRRPKLAESPLFDMQS